MNTPTGDAQYRDVSEATIVSMTEAAMADQRRDEGLRVVCHKGRYWQETSRGFYQSVHWLARLTADEATKPTRRCWGFRATLKGEEAADANGTMPVHMLSGVADYTEKSIPAKRRSDLRKSRRLVKIVQLRAAGILEAQGYEVAASAAKRTGHRFPPERQQYCASVGPLVSDPNHVVLAGLVEERLAGYLTGYAVQDVAYIETVVIATEYLRTAVGTALTFDFVQVCRRSEATIGHITYGLHCPEDPNLGVFKGGMGFPVVQIPSRVSIPALLRIIIRWRNRGEFYRLTGVGSRRPDGR